MKSGGFGPGVFGVFAAEFLADAGVVVAPEGGEVGGDLDGALANLISKKATDTSLY